MPKQLAADWAGDPEPSGFDDEIPARQTLFDPRSDPNSQAYAWTSIILGHLEEQVLQGKLNYKKPMTDPVNLPVTTQVIPMYLCPSASRLEEHRGPDGKIFNLNGQPGEGLACVDYLGISGPDKGKANPTTGEDYGPQRGVLLGVKGLPDEDKLMEPPAVTPAKITDGLSKTLLVVECTGRGADVNKAGEAKLNGSWASDGNVSHIKMGVNEELPPKVWEDERVFSDHPGGAMALACDGSVHLLPNDLDANVLRAYCSRDGEEDVKSFAAN